MAATRPDDQILDPRYASPSVGSSIADCPRTPRGSDEDEPVTAHQKSAVAAWSRGAASRNAVDQRTCDGMFTISGVVASIVGIDSVAALKCTELACSAPAEPSSNASTRRNWFGSSTLRDQSNHRWPGSGRAAVVKDSTAGSQLSAHSGRTVNVPTMTIMGDILARTGAAEKGPTIRPGNSRPCDLGLLLSLRDHHPVALGRRRTPPAHR